MGSLSVQSFISIILGLFGIFGTVFGIYHYFRNPQVNLEKKQALDDKQAENKAELLAREMSWDKEATEKRFADMGQMLREATTLAQNHIHTVDTKVDNLTAIVNFMNLETTKNITELKVIIRERFPKL